MNYKIKPSAAKEIFTLEDENGNTVADVRGLNLAKKFSVFPVIMDILELSAQGLHETAQTKAITLLSYFNEHHKTASGSDAGPR